ncbi:hypothetical protein SISSUDRAFT_580806 [Sistotremastrum suecicum HHB10207 ss-3]|uniref:CHAT domain-containing protein n=1 Tax=Sistotremastrum suecicum HHB10207 ss-3 TaxID=1314776 RepID=A0A166EPI5_9AGAM|nr:hypothetical protein SISSUDRAFT_580806 [Sistotremastrum suecicum HHB10207 ss-3]
MGGLPSSSRKVSSREQQSEDEDATLQHFRVILQNPKADATNRPKILHDLGTGLLARFDKLGRINDINSAVDTFAEAQKIVPSTDAEQAACLTDLGVALARRYERLGRVADIHEAVEKHSEAVKYTPRDSNYLPSRLDNLGSALLARYLQTSDPKDLEDAIDRTDRAVDLTSNDSLSRFEFQNHAGMALLYRYRRSNRAEDLSSAIERLKEAVELVPRDGSPRAAFLADLAGALHDRFDSLNNEPDINEAINCRRESLALSPQGSPQRVQSVTSLADSLHTRFHAFGQIIDINSAIETFEEALELYEPLDANRPRIIDNLCNALLARFDAMGELEDVESAIEKMRDVVDDTPIESIDRPRYLNTLAHALLRLHGRLGDVEVLDDAIRRLQEALDFTPDDNPERPRRLAKLGNAFLLRFNSLLGDIYHIAGAIDALLEAISLVSSGSLSQAQYLHDLGRCYLGRFDKLGEIRDIDCAIRSLTDGIAIDLVPDGTRADMLNNLGNALLRRSEWLGDIDDLNAAIDRLTQALDLTALDSAHRPQYLSDLGASLLCRVRRTGQKADVDRTIHYLSQAVGFIPADIPDRPVWLCSLGTALLRRWEMADDIHDLNASIERLEVGLDRICIDNSLRPGFCSALGNALMARYRSLNGLRDLNHAIRRHKEAAELVNIENPRRSALLNNLAESLLSRYQHQGEVHDFRDCVEAYRLSAISPYGKPHHRLNAAIQWATFMHEANLLQVASTAYDLAFDLLPQVVFMGLSAKNQISPLVPKIHSLGRDAAACMLARAASEPELAQKHASRAVELLEEGQTIAWSHAFRLRQEIDHLRAVDPQLGEDCDHSGNVLAQSCFRDPHDQFPELDGLHYRRALEDWEDLVRTIRYIPGFANFLLPLKFETLRHAADRGPVVTINVSKFRIDAVIIPPAGEVILLPIPAASMSDITDLATKLQQISVYGDLRHSYTWIEESASAEDIMQEVLTKTWRLFGKPILDKMEQARLYGKDSSSPTRVWWNLTGPLASLPIHAASPPPPEPNPGMMESVISSYTSSLTGLVGVSDSKSVPRKMLVVGAPETIGGGEQTVVAGNEFESIQKLTAEEIRTIKGEAARILDVSRALSEYTWIHFACSAVQDPSDPLKSGLILADGLLPLSRMAQPPLAQAQFAYLSSFQSATGSTQHPNEAFPLASAMQFIGFRGVIGTLWSVGDDHALKVTDKVYGDLFEAADEDDASKAAFALHKAMIHLRDEIKAPLTDWVSFVHFGL